MTSSKKQSGAHSGHRGVPEPRETYGAGYLYHHDAGYLEFADRLDQVGAKVDAYEFLGAQFNSEPDAVERFAKALGKPMILHSYEYCLGNVERPKKQVIDRIQGHARNGNVAYIGEHIGIMGTGRDYVGGFLQPPGTEEQTQILIDNVKQAVAESVCPIIVENPSQFYRQMGPISIGRQMRMISEEADVGLLLSLSNISISERFLPQDRDAFLAEIPLERVRELHVLCGNTNEERMSGMESTRNEHEWAFRMMRELAKNPKLKPAAVIFELESGTPSLPEPEKLRDYLDEARSLFFSAGSATR